MPQPLYLYKGSSRDSQLRGSCVVCLGVCSELVKARKTRNIPISTSTIGISISPIAKTPRASSNSSPPMTSNRKPQKNSLGLSPLISVTSSLLLPLLP